MAGKTEHSTEPYYDQFKDNEWAYFLIPQINLTKGEEFNISIIVDSNIKKAPLKALVSYLNKRYAKKYEKVIKELEIKPNASKTELASFIIKFVCLTHPHQSGIWPQDLESEEENQAKTNEPNIDLRSDNDSESTETDTESDDSDEDYCPHPTQKKSQTRGNETKIIEEDENELSQPITPYQPTKSPTEEKNDKHDDTLEYDHEIMKLAKSISDNYNIPISNESKPIGKQKPETMIKTLLKNNSYKPSENNTDESENQLSDGMRRLSIEEKNMNHDGKVQKRKKRKYMVNKTKEVILTENAKLNSKIEKLEKNIKEMNEEKLTMIAEKEREEKSRKEMEEDVRKLRDSIKEYDENDSKKIAFNLTNQNIEKSKVIEDLTKKYEDQKKRANEKQNEIKELKKSMDKDHIELNNLRMSGEKETALRVKNEGLMALKDEKIKNYEIKLKEYEDKLKLMEEQSEQKKAETSTLENKNVDVKEEFSSSDKLILADHEIRVRQEQMQEMIKTFTTEITQLNLSHMETFSEYKAEMEQKLRTIENENEKLKQEVQGKGDNKLENNLQEMEIIGLKNEKDLLVMEIEELKNQLENGPDIKINEKEKEIQNLKNELKAIADKKIEDIKSKTKPQNKKQGLPNKYSNTCFITATMHCLAKSVKEHELKDDELSQYIMKTKECLNGKRNEEDADEIMSDIWNYSKERWPEYIRNEECSNQEDVAEYLERMLNESPTIENLFKTEITRNITCQNPECEMVSLQTRETRNVNVSNGDEELSSITIQQIINEKIVEDDETVCPNCHHNAPVKLKIDKAPELLCIQYNRNLDDGDKVETQITNPDKVICVKERDKIVKYKIKAIVIHRGSETGNGHNICNGYDETRDEWMQIDDHRIVTENWVREENQEGILYLFRKTKATEPMTTSPNKEIEKEKTIKQKTVNSRRVKETSQIPCIYYRKNECERDDDCPYLHHTCQHHLRGTCKYKENCKYRHVDTDLRSYVHDNKRPNQSEHDQMNTSANNHTVNSYQPRYYTSHYGNQNLQA